MDTKRRGDCQISSDNVGLRAVNGIEDDDEGEVEHKDRVDSECSLEGCLPGKQGAFFSGKKELNGLTCGYNPVSKLNVLWT